MIYIVVISFSLAMLGALLSSIIITPSNPYVVGSYFLGLIIALLILACVLSKKIRKLFYKFETWLGRDLVDFSKFTKEEIERRKREELSKILTAEREVKQVFGTFTDSRDGKIYKTVVIGE